MFESKYLNVLEYPKILEELAGFAQSSSAKRTIRALVPATSFESVKLALDYTAEADKILFEYSVNPSFAVDDDADILKKAAKGSVLSISDLLKTARLLRVSRRLIAAVAKIPDAPLTKEAAGRLYDNEELEKKIFDSFLSETEVADNATPELRQIRLRIRKINENVRTKLQTYITAPDFSKYLQDTIVTVRGDRYVIPVKSEFKGQIAGLVHDQSASGSTLFVEPMQVVELNNELRIEKMNEQAEIERILRNLSTSVMAHADRLEWSYQTITDMDAVFARAQLAHAWKAVKPDINKKGHIRIASGRHPLIDEKKVVPVSLELKSEKSMLLITGPNTGGKTVTLKLVGLFTVMAMSGLYLPAKSADICVFDGVYCDIGDEQSIEQSLSTFSAHIKNIIWILSNITPASLVLLDELGAGTDPGEGAALAVSISEHLLTTGAKSFITSHFNDLKEFALVKDEVVAASMEFDSVSFSPTYKLIMGAIGSSNALSIAERLGLSKDIIENAKSKISTEKKQFDKVLTAAEETRRQAEMLVGAAAADRSRAAEVLKAAEIEKKSVVEKREKLNDSIRKETKRLIEESVEEASDIIEEMKELLGKEDLSESDVFTARKLKKKLENMTAEYDAESPAELAKDDSPLKSGDKVYISSLSKTGKLLSVSSRGEAEVSLGKFNVKAKKGDYFKIKD
jgi:DNA mismatch repair protein MutS2